MAQKRFIAALFAEFFEDDCPTMAAALAYYAALSMAPLFVIVTTVAGFFWRPEAVRDELQEQIRSVVGAGGWEQVASMMDEARLGTQGTVATLTSLAVLLLGATGIMMQLQRALNRTWGVRADPQSSAVRKVIVKRLMSLAMVLAVAFLLLVSLIVTAVLKAISTHMAAALPDVAESWTPQSIDLAASLVVTTLLFAGMFKWIPDARINWRDTWIGSAITAVLFLAGKLAIGMYLGTKGGGTYGAATSFVLLLIWVYYSGMIFLLGAELTQLWARRYGTPIVPGPGAIAAAKRADAD